MSKSNQEIPKEIINKRRKWLQYEERQADYIIDRIGFQLIRDIEKMLDDSDK